MPVASEFIALVDEIKSRNPQISFETLDDNQERAESTEELSRLAIYSAIESAS